VQSYRGLPEERIGVAEGSVQADTFRVLRAGEGIVAARQSGEWRNVPYRATVADWEQGNISLQDASFRELQLVLEQTYGMSVVADTRSIPACRITTSFRRSDSIHRILDALQLIYGITYTIKGNTVHLSGAGCPN
jgi:ferric-dicitrate binding protein FerR (iron transport regulator)